VGASLEVMAAVTQRMRPGRPWVLTNLRTHEGLHEVVRFIEARGLLGRLIAVARRA